jgi:amino-acid racemase
VCNVKTLGLIGGMSWESTVPYYRIINETIRAALGGQHSAPLLLYSVDFDTIERMQRSDAWVAAGALLTDAARRLETAGAELLVLCTNTMHRVAPAIESGVRIPLLHIADPTAAAIAAAGLSRVALLGTRFTMEQPFYRERLSERADVQLLIPPLVDRELVHHVIYDELCQGRINESSRAAFRRVIADLAQDGAQGVILGCTEIGLLITPSDSPVPLFDTAAIHARHAALAALSDPSCDEEKLRCNG